ncbi:MAG TPA: hypothetical protein DD412_03995 [Holosporales bacterium]|nr:hypothetical protein [Holosporales bacterium]
MRSLKKGYIKAGKNSHTHSPLRHERSASWYSKTRRAARSCQMMQIQKFHKDLLAQKGAKVFNGTNGE